MLASGSSVASVPLESLFLPNPAAIPVIHPDFKELGRLWIPVAFVLRTNGLQRFSSQHPHAPSMCTLFQKGKCKSRERCNQVHVDPGFGHMLNHTLCAFNVTNCCKHHGDPPSLATDPFASLATNVVELKVTGRPSIPVPVELIATTFFWNRLSQEKRPALFFPLERLCLLHQKGQCTFGAECRNVHVCRQWWAQVSAHIPAPAALPSPMRDVGHTASHRSLPNACMATDVLHLGLTDQSALRLAPVTAPSTPLRAPGRDPSPQSLHIASFASEASHPGLAREGRDPSQLTGSFTSETSNFGPALEGPRCTAPPLRLVAARRPAGHQSPGTLGGSGASTPSGTEEGHVSDLPEPLSVDAPAFGNGAGLRSVPIGPIGSARPQPPAARSVSAHSLFSVLPELFPAMRSSPVTPTLPPSPRSVAELSFDGSEQFHFEAVDELQESMSRLSFEI